MREALVDLAVCDGCQDCIESCWYDAIDLIRAPKAKRLKAWVDPDRCCGCNYCEPRCPQGGIVMIWVGPPLAVPV